MSIFEPFKLKQLTPSGFSHSISMNSVFINEKTICTEKIDAYIFYKITNFNCLYFLGLYIICQHL